MTPIELNPVDVAIAAMLVLLDAGISIALQLRLHRQLLWAATRMVVQLLLVGWVLRIVFALDSPAVTLGIIALMIAAAAREVAVRPVHRLRGAANYRIGALVVGLSGMATVMFALFTAIRPTPWYDPHYAIPLMGIVLGSVLNSASLGLDTFFSGVAKGRAEIEARLALGATRNEALAPLMRDAVRKGMIPIINQMSAAGIITLPGTMTGQILAGMDPFEAVKYQIMLMFLLTGGGGLAAVGAVYLASWSVTDERHRLRTDRLVGPSR
jgi:putative ABC transport system permease protein